jgi:hypothetical protein
MVVTNLVIAAWIENLICWILWCAAFVKPNRQAKGQKKVGERGVVSLGHRAGVRRLHADLDMAQTARISEVDGVIGRLDDCRPDFRFFGLGLGT